MTQPGNYLSIGNLNERVTLQAESHTDDGSGGYISVWVDTATLWAAVTPVSGAEVQTGEQLSSRSRYRFSIRERPGVTAAHRLVWRNAALNIRSITHNPAAARLDILAEDGAPT